MVEGLVADYFNAAALNIVWTIYLAGVTALGYFIYQIIRNKFDFRLNAVPFLQKSYFFWVLLCFSLGVLAVGLFSIPFYFFELPSSVFSVVVILAIVLCSGFYIKEKSPLAANFIRRLNKGIKIKVDAKTLTLGLVWLAVIVFFIADVTLSVRNGALYADGSDLYVHYSRVFDIARGDFTIRDGFLLGVDEVRYAYNFIYALMTPIFSVTNWLNASMVTVGSAAHVAFRALQFLAAGSIGFALLSYLTRLRTGKLLLGGALAATLTFMFYHFFSANYPNNIVFVWFSLLLIGMLLVHASEYRREGWFVMVLSAILATGTHPTYAFIASMFVFISYVGIWLYQLFSRQLWKRPKELFGGTFIVSVVVCVLLLLSTIFVYVQPNNLTEASKLTESAAATLEIMGVKVFPPLQELVVRHDSLILIVLTIVGTITLLRLSYQKSKELFIILATMMFFVLLTSSNPLFVGIMQQLDIPYWLIRRFNALNIVMFYQIILLFGVYGVYYWAKRLAGSRKKYFRKFTYAVMVVVMVWGSVAIISEGIKIYKRGYSFGTLNKNARDIYKIMDDQVVPYIKGSDKVVLATQYTSYYLPLVSPVKVIYIDSNHTPPPAAALEREQCQNTILDDHLTDAEALRGNDIKYIVLDNFQPNDKYTQQVSQLRQYKNDFTELNVGGTYAVFEVKPGGSEKRVNSCSLYKKIEQ